MDFKTGRDEDMHLFASCQFFRNVTEGKNDIGDYINRTIHHPPLLYLTSLPFHLLFNDPTQRAAQWAMLFSIFFGVITSLYLAKTLGSLDSSVFALLFFSLAMYNYEDAPWHFAPYIMAAAFVPLVIALAYRSRNFERTDFTVLTFFAAGIGFLYYYALPVYLLFLLAIPAVSGLLGKPKITALNLALGMAIFSAIALIYLVPMGLFDWLKSWLAPSIQGQTEALTQVAKRIATTFAIYSSLLFFRTTEFIPLYVLCIIGFFFKEARKKSLIIAAGTVFTLLALSFLKIIAPARLIPMLLVLGILLLSLPVPRWLTRIAVILGLVLGIIHLKQYFHDSKEGLLHCRGSEALIWALQSTLSEPNGVMAGNISPSAIDRITCELNLKFDRDNNYLTYIWGDKKIAERLNKARYIFLLCPDDKYCDWFDFQELVSGFAQMIPKDKAEALAEKVMDERKNYKTFVSIRHEPMCKPEKLETVLIRTEAISPPASPQERSRY